MGKAKGPIERAVLAIGQSEKPCTKGICKAARLCEVTPRAVRQWIIRGRLPRTEATEETNYATILSIAQTEVSREDLYATAFRLKEKRK